VAFEQRTFDEYNWPRETSLPWRLAVRWLCLQARIWPLALPLPRCEGAQAWHAV